MEKHFWIIDEDGDVEYLVFTPDSTRQKDWSYDYTDNSLRIHKVAYWEYDDRNEHYYFNDKDIILTDHHELIVNNIEYVNIITTVLKERVAKLKGLEQNILEIKIKIKIFRDETKKLLTNLKEIKI